MTGCVLVRLTLINIDIICALHNHVYSLLLSQLIGTVDSTHRGFVFVINTSAFKMTQLTSHSTF